MDVFTSVAMTYNLWGPNWWPQRMPALRALFERRPPDLLAVQELQPESRQLIDDVLPGHARIDDEFPGWSTQSNIWWDRDLYELQAYGAEDIGMRSEFARLFWVRLKVAAFDSGPALLFATAHYTFQKHPQEWLDGISPRVEQARRTVMELTRLAPESACVFGGDLNDFARPIQVLREAGFTDSFGALDRPSPVTHPAFPNASTFEQEADLQPISKAIDFLFHRGPIRVRSSEVVESFHQGIAPSDHKPVVATYTMRRPR